MLYTVEPLLYDTRRGIYLGLKNGSLTRWGGVIRHSAGQPRAGQIVAHLRDLVSSAASEVVSEKLGVLLQLSHVTAATSVLNLGVSAVGMVVLGRKLNKLQEDMTTLFRVLDQNHRELSGKLGNIQENLIELKYLALQGNSLVIQAIEETRKVRQDLLSDKIARLLADQKALVDPSTSHSMIEHILRSSREIGVAMGLALERDSLERDAPHRWPEQLARYRIWCIAISLEVAALRRLEKLQGAFETSKEAAGNARRRLNSWVSRLLPEPGMNSVHRFGYSGFDVLPREVHERIWRIPSGELTSELEHDEERLEAAIHIAQELPALPPNWVEQQMALAQMLDFLEETTERLESASSEMEFCYHQGLTPRSWEELPSPSNTPVGLLVTSEI